MGLYVAVDDALGMGGLQRLGDLERHGRCRFRWEGASFEDPVLQGATGQVLHGDVVRVARVLAAVVDRDDVRVREGGGALRLTLEALHELLVVGVTAAHHLERHVPVQDVVVREVNLRHPAAAERPADTVPIVYKLFQVRAL